METLLKSWGGEEAVIRFDRPTGAWIVIAIDSTRLGPATGGTRMRSYPDLRSAVQDALALASGMTLKYALSGLPTGGGKAVIAVPENLDPDLRPDLLRRYGALVRQLGGTFRPGSDVGTCAADMDVVAETGAPYVYSCSAAKGGAGDSAPATALGVLAGMEVVCGHLDGQPSLAGRRVVVQGAGAVGGQLVELLARAGAEVLFSDVRADAVHRVRDRLGIESLEPEAVYDTPCDLFAPCALGGVLGPHTIGRLRCRAVAGAANNQLARPEDAEALRQRGILYAPDFVLSLGGGMCIVGMESMGWTQAEAQERVQEAIRKSLDEVFTLAAAMGTTTDAAARQIARRRIEAASTSAPAAPSRA